MPLLNRSTIGVARSRFESARYLDTLPHGHRSRALHGHGFIASVFARLTPDMALYQGGEVSLLQNRITACVSELDYRLLNDVLPQPTDENLARWILGKLGSPTTHSLAIQSTPDQGVEVDSRNHAHVWRRYHFHAAHQLPHVPEGHKCGRMHGHGFQVIVHADLDTVDSGLSVDYDYLDALWSPLSDAVNYQCLNNIPGLSNPTSEMLSSWIWERLKPGLPQLSSVTVYETASCGAAFDGMNYRIWKDFTIDSAVQSQFAPPNDPRHALHGDTFTLRLHLSAPLDEVMGWTVDFGDVKSVFNPIFKALDHQPLHTWPEFSAGDTTSIARWVYKEAKISLPQVVRVDVVNAKGAGTLLGNDLGGPALPV